MDKKKSGGVLKPLITFLKILLLIAVCVAVAFVMVYPLWKFSTAAPGVYSAVILALILAALVFLIITRTRKTGTRTTLKFLINLLLALAAAFLFVYFVIDGARIAAFASLALILAAMAVFNLIFSRLGNERR